MDLQSDELFSNRILALMDVIYANGLGLWELADNKIKLDQKSSESIGLSGENKFKLEDWIKLIQDDDQQELRDLIKDIKNNPGKNGMAECRIINQNDHTPYWMRIMGKSYLNQGKKVVLGTIQLIEGRALDVFNEMIDSITKELNKKEQLNKCIFEITEILLNADDAEFEKAFQSCMETTARAAGLTRVYINKNHIIEGTLCCTEIHEWVDGLDLTLGEDFTTDIPLHSWTGLEQILNEGKNYNMLVKDAPQEIQEMTPNGIGAMLITPIFLKDLLWGFIGYEWREEKIFGVEEEATLSSIALLMANSLIRNDLNKNLYLAVDKINTTTIKAEELEKFAYTDTLTGLYNRRHFMEIAQKPLEKAQRTNVPCYLMVLDLDFFKKVNDTYGHLAGDEVLKNAALVMKNALRSYDLLARYGGEEFVVLISETKKKIASQAAERIRESVAAQPSVYNLIKIPATVSIGVAASTPDCTLEELIDMADKALYKAKETGRNKVVFYEEIQALVAPSSKKA